MNRENIKDYLQNRNVVMCITSFFFMMGIFAYFSQKEIIIASIVTFVLIFLLFVSLSSIKRVLFLAFVFYFGFFFSFFKIKNSDMLIKYAPVNSTFQGRIVSIPNSPETDKTKFFLDVEKIGDKNVKGKSLVTISAQSQYLKQLNIGEKISLKGNLRKPFRATNPSQFDYSKYLRNFGVFTVIYSEDDSFKILNENLPRKWKFLNSLNNVRNSVLSIHSKYLKSPNLEILGGIVFGDDAVAPPDYIKSSFINSGLLHILAASGMNVAFIFTFWFYIMQFLKVPYKPRVISGMLMVILYTLMTGLGASVIRASLMLLFVLAGKLIDRDAHSISLLSLVAVLMLLYNPAYINDVGFQLSFMVTFGLLTSANVLNQKFEKIPNWIKSIIFIPLVAQIWVAPIQMFYFNTISVYSILANISTVSLLSVISFSGFVSSVLAIFKPIANQVCMFFDFINNYLITILINISNFFGNLPHCIVESTHPNVIQLVMYYIMLIFATFFIQSNKYKKAFITIISVSFILLATTITPVSKELEITAFDVGNADCFLIKTPQQKYFFIDTGKAPYKSGNTQAKIIMLKYLKDRGIKNIKGVIVTHFDNDHSGGTSDIISNTNTEILYLNNNNPETQTAKNIFSSAKQINQKIKFVQNNAIIYKEPNLTIKTYKANINGKDKSNDSSTVTLLTYNNFNMLFMADAGTETFETIKDNIPHNIEVLKVGHHGGPDVVNQNMLEHLNTKVSIISTGTNYFGHPNKGTLDVLRKTDILRTDLLNAIKISSDGEHYKIFTYDNYSKKYKIKNSYITE